MSQQKVLDFKMIPDYIINKQFNAYTNQHGITLDWENEAFL